MALTVEGRALTEAHRIAQVGISTRFLAASAALLDEINPADIDANLTDWAGLQVLLAERFHTDSTTLAGTYLREYRIAEAGAAGADMPIVRSVFDALRSAEQSMLISPMAKQRIARGTAPQPALEETFFRRTGPALQRNVLAGGRDLIDRSTLANTQSIGWRRVPDGNPCTFCAMLSSRGPDYRTPKTAGLGRRFHARCGCTVEEVFGEWVPTEREKRYVDAYNQAAAGDSEKKILDRMRASGEFNDSPGQRPSR